MPDSRPPRIRVTLPGGGDIPGQLLRWRQDPATGQWWAEVVVHVPAAAVQQVPGEDYTAVPREPATTERYVLSADTRTQPPTAELHTAACWEIAQPAAWRRDNPLSAQDARDQLKFPGTKTCPVCTPAP